MSNEYDSHIEALRRRQVELEREIWASEAVVRASPGSTESLGNIEVLHWRKNELRAVYAALQFFEDRTRRSVPIWLLVVMSTLTLAAIAIAGWALWLQILK